MSVATRFLVYGKRGLRAIEQPGDGGATLYYGDFGKGVRRIWAPPPDFSSLEERDRRRAWRPLLLSGAMHFLLFAILLISAWRDDAVRPKPDGAPGMEVTFAEDGGQRRMTQSEVSPDPAHSGTGRDEVTEAPTSSLATPIPADALRAPSDVPVSDAKVDAGPAPAPRAPVESDPSPTDTDKPRARPATTDRADEDRWEGEVLARLQRKQRYPAEALRLGKSDVVMIRITIDRHGKLLLAELVKSQGIKPLDDEAMALAKRAQPYPEPPSSVVGDAIQLLVPVDYEINKKK
ncbi:energy transducer TonB [Sphingomonas sp.]|uniref:energy transducer TonB family protein n=1 Tax=Sphingomonas sp. TaxID=28214 RepID=UPI0025E29677|nr:energy transducer TonB [Sphingomonas sp.]